jgi:hypothetical protein
MPMLPADLIIIATERWHSMPRRYLPNLVRADYVDTGDRQYVRMFAAKDEMIGLYEVERDGQLTSVAKPWPKVTALPATYTP